MSGWFQLAGRAFVLCAVTLLSLTPHPPQHIVYRLTGSLLRRSRKRLQRRSLDRDDLVEGRDSHHHQQHLAENPDGGIGAQKMNNSRVREAIPATITTAV